MDAEKRKSKITKVEEPAVSYNVSKTKQKGIDQSTFDFDAEMERGYTPEEFKVEMVKRIKAYPWKK